LKVAAYVHPDRAGGPETGVAKHIRHMVLQLGRRPEADLSLAARADYAYLPWYTRLLPAAYATYPVNEFRPARMSWLWLEPHAVTAGRAT
jgi:hypothetical protein